MLGRLDRVLLDGGRDVGGRGLSPSAGVLGRLERVLLDGGRDVGGRGLSPSAGVLATAGGDDLCVFFVDLFF